MKTGFGKHGILAVLSLTALLLLIIPGCEGEQRKSLPGEMPSGVSPWSQLKNGQPVEANEIYFQDAVKFFPDGGVIQGAQEIAAFHANNTVRIDTLWTLFQVKANPQYVYEIGAFRSKDEIFHHLLVLDSVGKRVFECISLSQPVGPLESEIERSRDRWMALCNAHDASKLVEEMYAEQSQYFNHKPLVSKKDLTAEYSYMNRPNYSLTLTPLHVQMVTKSLAYEIGQCAGSYGGKYMIIWRREGENPWRVLFDSNI